jgi:hypothetical protein
MTSSALKIDWDSIGHYLQDQKWRLNNIYTIINKHGDNCIFEFNWAQKQLYDNIWYSNIILKARQLGISTFVCLLFLDVCLFKDNIAAGIIAHTREDAEHMFKRIKFAYDNLDPDLKAYRPATISSARELVFNNNSSLRVGTSMRGSTLQYLHISEFGKICAHFPDKAREIVTGSLNTLGNRQHVFIESTAEGKEGYFYDLCKQSENFQIAKKKLTPLDYKFHFFPWYKCPDYSEKQNGAIPKEIQEYFVGLEEKGIDITDNQRFWYYKKLLIQKDDMKREYPSTPDESFESAIDGSFYAKWIREARFEGRVGNVPWDRQSRVSLAFDPGYLDSCAIVFFQCIGQEIHIIDYYENSGEGLSHYLSIIKAKPYVYESYFGPHDIESHQFSTGLSTKEVGASMGVSFITLPTLKTRLEDGIEAVRNLFPRFWIDEKNCTGLIKCIENYRKEFDVNYQIYKSKPVHDKFSHGADALRYMAIAIKTHIDSSKGGMSEAEAERMYNKYHPIFT